MTDEKDKEFKIEFAPGCFDQFEGSQEELDEMVAEIQKLFASKTREEIEAMSKPLSEEDFAELPEDIQVQLVQTFSNLNTDEDSDNGSNKRLH
jgi:hypothetical protein